MFSYRLKLDEGQQKAVYGPSPALRIISAFFLVVFIYGSVRTSFSVLSSVCIALLFFASLYRDEWIIDRGKGVAVDVSGLGPFVRRKEYPFSTIDRIEVTHFVKGVPGAGHDTQDRWNHRRQAVLSLRMKDGSVHDIEIASDRKAGSSLASTAASISSFTGLPMSVDRPSDASVRH